MTTPTTSLLTSASDAFLLEPPEPMPGEYVHFGVPVRDGWLESRNLFIVNLFVAHGWKIREYPDCLAPANWILVMDDSGDQNAAVFAGGAALLKDGEVFYNNRFYAGSLASCIHGLNFKAQMDQDIGFMAAEYDDVIVASEMHYDPVSLSSTIYEGWANRLRSEVGIPHITLSEGNKLRARGVIERMGLEVGAFVMLYFPPEPINASWDILKVAILSALLEESGLPCLLSGGERPMRFRDEVGYCKACKIWEWTANHNRCGRGHFWSKRHRPRILGGESSWDQFCIASMSRIAVSTDSSIAHLLGVSGHPTVVLYTNKDGRRYGGIYPSIRIVQGEAPCGPCGLIVKTCRWIQDDLPLCSRNISAESVFEAVQESLRGPQERPELDRTPTTTSCVLCSQKAVLAAQRGPISYYTCLTCETSFCSPMPDPEFLVHHYSQDYVPEYLTEPGYILASQGHGRHALQGLESVGYEGPKEVFEIGAGGGWSLQKFAEKGWKCRGLEPAKNLRANCKRLGLNVGKGFFPETKPAPPAPVVFLSHVFEHFTDPDLLMESLRESVTDGGYLVILTPCTGNFRYLPEWEHMNTSFAGEHVVLYSERSIQALMEKHGFTVKKSVNSGHEIWIWAQK